MKDRWYDWRGRYRFDEETGEVSQECACGDWKSYVFVPLDADGWEAMHRTDWLEAQFHKHRVDHHGYGRWWLPRLRAQLLTDSIRRDRDKARATREREKGTSP